jgi:tetratricopeptide (TPR) repeat protein
MEKIKSKPKRVFISYSSSDQLFQDRIRSLADTLRIHGVESILDQYFTTDVRDWVAWMTEEVEKADMIIAVCESEYHERITKNLPPGIGLGSHWEGKLIRNLLFAKNNKPIIVVQFSDLKTDLIPTELIGNQRFIISNRVEVDNEYLRMFRMLTAQPSHVPPMVGEILRLDELPDSKKIDLRSLESISSHQDTIGIHGSASPKISGRVRGGRTPYNVKLSEKISKRARTLERDEMILDALDLSLKALQLDGGNNYARDIAVRCLFELKRYEECLNVIEQNKDKKIDNVTKFYLINTKEKLMENYDGSDDAKELFESIEDREKAKMIYSDYLLRNHRYEDTFNLLMSVSRPSAYEKSLLSKIPYCLWKLGRTKESFEILASADKSIFSGSLWCNYGIAAAELGFFGIAIDAHKKGIDMEPNNQFCVFSLAEIFAYMDRVSESMELLLELHSKKSTYLSEIKEYPAFKSISDSDEFEMFLKLIT